MRRTSLVGALCAGVLLAALPAVPAVAAPEHCSDEVRAVRGTQPTYAEVDAWLQAAATKHAVPLPILRVIAYKESTWRQFAADGSPLISSDGVCGVGLMQVTADGRPDAVDLASSGEYNADAGAAILKEKWVHSQQTPPPSGYAADDPDVIENWYYAICLYNGCPGNEDDSYARDAAKYLHDPFRWLPAALREFVRPAGFTTPYDVNAAYDFPAAFQARTTAAGGEFVFYDHVTGTVLDVEPARVHRVSAPPSVTYPAHALGPDAPGVTCVQCGGWRLWEGAGRIGRAHWTNSVTGAAQAKVDWHGFGYGPGRYRVDAFIPALGGETLGTATYTFTGNVATTATVDQNAVKGGWVTLTQRVFAGTPHVTLGDASGVAGQKIVADAIRLVPAPILTLQRVTPETATYGNRVRLYLTLRYENGDGVRYRYVTLHRRPLGGSWQKVATLRTSDMGAAGTILTAERNVEYMATFTPAPGDYLASASSPVVRQYVTPRVLGSFSPSASPLSGEATTLNASVAPAHAGHAVHFQRWGRGGWQTVAYGRLDTYGRARWSFRSYNDVPCGGPRTEQYRVYKPADHDHVAGASGVLTLTVRARCYPGY